MTHRTIFALLAAPTLLLATAHNAQADTEDVGLPRLGLDPGEPQVRSAPPNLPFGMQPALSKQFVLDFHGYFLLPASAGLHRRKDPAPGQGELVLHAPPLIPQNQRSFDYTAAVPTPWLQLNFVYGNETVAATAIIAGTSATDGAGYYNPVDQAGINDAYITLNLTKHVGFPLKLNVGAYTGRYGAMGTYDAGRYGTPFIARTNTIGGNLSTAYELGDVTVLGEVAVGGQIGRPPQGLVPGPWNDFAEEVGATFVSQAHLGAAYKQWGTLGLHYINAWTSDDLVAGGEVPDASINVMGADLRLNAGRAGHLYAGYSHTKATNARYVGGAIEVLNARGGPELMQHYLGPESNGSGSLDSFGLQYDLSVARLIYGDLFTGNSPDIMVSLFGIGTAVGSRDADYDNVTKLKFGTELSYLMTRWFGASGRFDHVRRDVDDSFQSFSSISGRLLFHTDWRSNDEIALQYTYYDYGSDIDVETGAPPIPDPTVNPDAHVFVLAGTYWW